MYVANPMPRCRLRYL